MSEIKVNVAAKAVIVNDQNKVLVVREATTYEEGTHFGQYGLPGGRIREGESFYDGLDREVLEETGLKVAPIMPVFVGEWRPTIKGVETQIIALFIACKLIDGEVRLSEEHDHFEWIDPADRGNYDFMPPDDQVVDRLGFYLANGVLASTVALDDQAE